MVLVLDHDQCKAMLYRTEKVIQNGFLISEEFPFLGDLVRCKCSEIYLRFGKDRRQNNLIDHIHVEEVVSEVLGFKLPTVLDDRTQTAFGEAKAAVRKGKAPSLAWPDWYLAGKRAPIELPIAS